MQPMTGASSAHSLSSTAPAGIAPSAIDRWWDRLVVAACLIGKTLRLASCCLLLYWIALIIGTHLPSASLPRMYFGDKVLHLGAYAGLAFLLSWAIPTRNGQPAAHLPLTFGICVAYGIIDELTQLFVPGRCCCIFDMTADVVGAGIGAVAYLFCRQLIFRFPLGRRLIEFASR